MKKSIYLILVLVLASGIDAYSQRIPVGRLREMVPTRESKPEVTKKEPTPLAQFATVYLGAVPSEKNTPGETYGVYYTNDPFEKVSAYYRNEVGSPIYVTPNKMEQYEYLNKTLPNGMLLADKVWISFHPDGSEFEDILAALKEIEESKDMGTITGAEFNEISNRFRAIKGIWKENNPASDIFQKCWNRLNPEVVGDKMVEDIQPLIRSGMSKEDQAYIEQRRNELLAAVELYQTPQYADEWKKCLIDMEKVLKDKKNYWNVKIYIWQAHMEPF